jgi:(1->4)-alpha-D-glucan 1-alpha-D-glucosylmutase
MTPQPTATYRLQLHAGFTFDHAAEVVPYLADLGVSHVYLSPVLTAVPGSVHGYDVLDHITVSEELGGRTGLERLSSVCRGNGLGVVVDIVPNHMALVAPEWANRPLWQVLREGRRAPTAHWFDVDWDALDGRFGLPVLGQPLEQVLAAGELTLDTGRAEEGLAEEQPVLRYFDHVFPVAPGTGEPGDDVREVLDRQHYVLASWREADEVLNYRRFFEVDGLIGVRVEESDVFERTHRLLLDLHHAGVIDAFRIDHPDGLADPEGYLAMLARHVRRGTPVWVEKILEGEERLPPWACSGTTGYDAVAALQPALIDPATVDVVDRAWRTAGGEPDLEVVVDTAKREAVSTLLVPELNRLERLAARVLPNLDRSRLRACLEELLVAVDAYRAYVRPGHTPRPEDERRLQSAVDRAVERRPDLADDLRTLGHVLVSPESGQDTVAGRDLCVRFQQTTGPVMAKGIEDTAFYRWHRLVALNEVGADPAAPADPERLHVWATHQAEHWPLGMTTLSTHDTKRSEDVRARLLALAGDGGAWTRCSEAFAAAAREHRVDGPTAHLVWQTIAGAGDLDDERLEAYLTKAVREGKEHTSWVDVDEEYEGRVLTLAREALHGPLGREAGAAVDAVAEDVRAVLLGQKLLQLLLPGVPDTYQGCELVNLSLVDPDNRRPVDFAERRDRLARLDAGEPPRDLSDEKLLVTVRALRLRRRDPDAFGPGSTYEPLHGGEHVLGYLRAGRVAALAVRAPAGLRSSGGFGDETVDLPAGQWVDELTGRRVTVATGAPPRAADLLQHLPVALLVRTGG